jgi:hypothetical protein
LDIGILQQPYSLRKNSLDGDVITCGGDMQQIDITHTYFDDYQTMATVSVYELILLATDIPDIIETIWQREDDGNLP